MWFYILTVIFLAMAIWGLLTWLEARLEARMKKLKNQDVL
jgi:hypothetical protein